MLELKAKKGYKKFILLVVSLFLFTGCNQTEIQKTVRVREGTVKYNDCREIIILEENSLEKNKLDFICEYSRSQGGKVLGGLCVHAEIDQYNKCSRAYIYYAEPELQCAEGTFPTIYDTCEYAE